jgi:ATP-dependent Lon protease
VLGVPRLERDKYESNDVAGVVTGLAWTSVGGDILYRVFDFTGWER